VIAYRIWNKQKNR